MSAVVDVISDVFEDFIAITVTTLTLAFPFLSVPLAAFCEDCKDYMLEQIGVVLGWLGIKEEDIVETNVTDQLLYANNDLYKNLMTKVALEHQATQKGIIELLAQYSMFVKQDLSSYYKYGENSLQYGLPDTNINVPTIPIDKIIPYILSEYGQTSISIINAYFRAPVKEEWYSYKLWQLYQYQPSSQLLTYTDTFKYKVKYVDYNYTTNKYDVTMFRPATEVTEVTITITPFDATRDNKNTHTVVTRYLIEGSQVVSDTSVDELIPIGSEVNSYTSSSVDVEYMTTVISIDSYTPLSGYVIKFYWTNDADPYYWIYQLNTGKPDLDGANSYVTQLSMLPIVALRNDGVNVNSNTLSAKYIEAKKILDFIGVDVDAMIDSINQNPNIADIEDAFIYFGLDIGQSDPIAARMLYQMFEFIFYDAALQTGEGTVGYTATFREGAYNASLSWQTQTRTVVNGVIGPIGTYQNLVGADGTTPWVKVRKQETPEQYVEYKMTNMVSATYIQRGGFYGVVTHTPQNGLRIPLSKFFIDQLSPLEQLDLFAKTLRLQVYALQVTHLDWYETQAFFDLIKIVLYVAAAVAFILTIKGGGFGWETVMTLGKAILLSLGTTYALKMILESSAPNWLKIVAAVAVIAASAYATGVSDPNTFFNTADAMTNAVTLFSDTLQMYQQIQMEELMTVAAAFAVKYENVMGDMEKKMDEFKQYLDTDWIAKLANMEQLNGYLEGPDMRMYRAVQMQYDWDLVKSMDQHTAIYDYDRMFLLGVTS